MGQSIVKNPETGKYQIFSTVVDSFLLEEEVTEEGLFEYWKERYGSSGVDSLRFTLNSKVKMRGTMTYEQAKMWNDHSVGHKHGSQAPRGSPSFPNTCNICKECETDG